MIIMALCTIKIHYPNSENWQVGDVVEISNPTQLIKEGKVELYVEPVVQEETVVEVAPEEVIVQLKKRGRKKKYI